MKSLLVALGAAAVMVLAGCGGITATPAGSRSASSTPGATPTSSRPVGIQPCRADEVRMEWASGGNGAGHAYGFIVVTNTSVMACTLAGTPAVANVDAAGAAVGAPATRDTSLPASRITLGVGQRAAAPMDSLAAGVHDDTACDLTDAAGLRVTLPGDAQSATVSHPSQACANVAIHMLSVRPFTTSFRTVAPNP